MSIHLSWSRFCSALIVALWLVIALLHPGDALADDGASATHPPRAPRRVEAPIASAEVELSIFRGGETGPGGQRIPRSSAIVRGEVRYELGAPAQPGQVIRLLDFAGFMRTAPIELDEVALGGYLPGPFKAAKTTVLDFDGAASMRRVGENIDLEFELLPGAREVVVRYEVLVPRRYWPLGCVRRRCSLSGAVAPLPSAPADGGRYLERGDRVVVPVRWTVSRAEFGDTGEVALEDEPLWVVGGDGGWLEYPTVVWGPHWRRTTEYREGVRIDVLAARRRPGAHAPNEPITQLRRDVVGRITAVTRQLIAVGAALGHPPKPGSRVVAIVGPLRSEVAQAHPGAVLVSDQAFEVVPAERIAKFHEEALARAVADVLMLDRFREQQDPSTSLWISGSMAFSLLDRWRLARAHRDEFAGDLLRRLTFVPAVDRFLYTQQASFSSSYFRGVEDDPPLRNHPLWYAHGLPTGRRIHEKLSDTLGPEALARFEQKMFERPGARPQIQAERAWGRELGWFFDQWLGPYPDVDYLVESVERKELPPAATERFEYTIKIRKVGTRTVIEPVQVLVTERKGKTHFLIWNGQIDPRAGSLDEEPASGVHTFVLRTQRKVANVRLDPRNRLVQTPIAPTNVDPRFNDRDPAQFRFLYTGAGLSIAASEFFNAATPAARFNAVAGFASFEASLRRDLRRTGHVLVARDRESVISVGTGVNLRLGAKNNRQRRRSRVRIFYTAGLLSDRSLDPRGGLRMIERIAFANDTRRFAWWPERGRALAIGVAARHVLRLDDTEDDRHDLAASAEWVQLWPLAHNHVLASLLRAEMVVPLVRKPEFRALSRVGGIGGLSGYSADEAFGLGLVTAQAEYRHVFYGDMHLNVAHLSYVRSVGGVLFAGAASTSECESYAGWFGPQSWYSHVGYGITSRLAILGVTPQLLRLEASVPLVRRQGVRCLDKVLPDFLAERQGLDDATRLLPPFNINLLFTHAF